MRIDPRIHHVGISYLRKCNADKLRGLGDNTFVLQDGDEPVSVLVSYEMFMQMQSAIEKAELMLEKETGR